MDLLRTLGRGILFILCAFLLDPAGGSFAQTRPITFGASISLTGKYAQTGLHFRRCYELWQQQINARDGLLGRPVEFIILDDKSDPTTGVKLYEKLITQDKVDLVLGPYSSAVTFAVSNVTEKYGYPMLAAGASSSEIWQRGHRYIFMTVAPGETYLDGAIDLAAKNNLKRVALINADSLYPKAFAKAAIEKIRARGLQLVLHEEYPDKVTDLSAILTKVKSAGAHVLLSGTYFQDAVLIVRQLKELDVNVKILAQTVGPSLPDFGKSLGPDAEYVYGASQWEAVPTLGYPGIGAFIEDFKKAYGYPPTYQSAEAYGVMQVMDRAIKEVGSLDRQKIRDTLARTKVDTVFGPYEVDERGIQIAKTVLLIQWQKGERVVVWPDSVATHRAVLPTPEWNKRR